MSTQTWRIAGTSPRGGGGRPGGRRVGHASMRTSLVIRGTDRRPQSLWKLERRRNRPMHGADRLAYRPSSLWPLRVRADPAVRAGVGRRERGARLPMADPSRRAKQVQLVAVGIVAGAAVSSAADHTGQLTGGSRSGRGPRLLAHNSNRAPDLNSRGRDSSSNTWIPHDFWRTAVRNLCHSIRTVSVPSHTASLVTKHFPGAYVPVVTVQILTNDDG